MTRKNDIIPDLCECGKPNRHGGEQRRGQRKGCVRCIELEDKMNIRKTTSGVREGDSRYGYRDIIAACDRFLRSRGIPTKNWHA